MMSPHVRRFLTLVRSYLLLTAVLMVLTVPVLAQPLKFAPLPMEAPETVAGQWRPLLDYLSRALGRDIQLSYFSSYQEIVEKFIAGELDLAFFGPLPYVRLKEQFAAARPVVLFNEADGHATYTCSIVALAEGNLDLGTLRGHNIALTQPLSTCGYLSADWMLHRAGSDLENNHYRYLGTHDAVAVAVARGAFDAGCLKTAIGRKYAHLGLVEIAETEQLPALGLVANGDRLPEPLIDQIRQLLIHADPATHAGWGDNIRHGAVGATDEDFEPVREWMRGFEIPLQGNF